jgi:AcrR family transcriptional regulator
MKTKNQIVTEFRRHAILDAARKVFARKGFSQGIVDDIATEAGLAKGTIYLYFRSKKDIYKALLHHDMEALKANALERIAGAVTLREKMAALALVRLENAEANREIFRIMDTQPANLSFTRSQYRDWLQEPVLQLAAAIEDAQRRGEVTAVPAEKAAWAVSDMVRGAIQRRLLGQTDLTLDQEAEFVVDLIWAALRPHTTRENA